MKMGLAERQNVFLGLLTWRQIGHGQEPINQTDSNIDVEFLGQIIVSSLRRHEM